MEENVLSGISGVGIYGVLSICIFVSFFVGMVFWVFWLKKPYLQSMEELPLDPKNDGPDNDSQVNQKP
jgi:cytochrome c oxidase cbb3-type subunit 4